MNNQHVLRIFTISNVSGYSSNIVNTSVKHYLLRLPIDMWCDTRSYLMWGTQVCTLRPGPQIARWLRWYRYDYRSPLSSAMSWAQPRAAVPRNRAPLCFSQPRLSTDSDTTATLCPKTKAQMRECPSYARSSNFKGFLDLAILFVWIQAVLFV